MIGLKIKFVRSWSIDIENRRHQLEQHTHAIFDVDDDTRSIHKSQEELEFDR
jgi:hypothetical protein